MHERVKATNIPKEVKQAVWERDNESCLVCGKWVPVECACCHIVSRARMGLGCEENIITLCHEHHRLFDGYFRGAIYPTIRRYMESKYPGWNEDKLIYSKWGWTHGEDK